MNHAESRAKLVIEAVVQGSEMRFKTDQSRGAHDFDLYLVEGAIEAVEVTASVDREAEETNAAIVNPKKGGPWIPTRLCKRDWHIHPEPDARITRIRAEADRCLAEIEAAGLDKFFGPSDWADHECVRRAYQDLRIFSGTVVVARAMGRITMASPGGGGAVGELLVHRAVLQEASKADNRRKLARSGCARRHLAIYFHSGNFLPWVALIDMQPPQLVVKLPVEITDVWAFSENRQPCGYSVWKARNSEHWQNVGPFTIADAV
jgi:hypothetical protein